MSLPRLSWNMDEDGVVTIYATYSEDRVFDLCDVWRQPAIEKGHMDRNAAIAFQVFAAERICAAWNSDKDAAEVSRSHIIQTEDGQPLTDWGQGHNAACEQIAHEIRRGFKF
jgi:hypothetical protein